MTVRTVAMPLYLLDDAEIDRLETAAIEVMTELAGESDTAELPQVIEALRAERTRRSNPVEIKS